MTTVLMSSFSRALTPDAQTAPPSANRNWNPGNYIAETANDSTALFNQIVTRLQADTAGHWKGVLLRYTWPMLEPTQGNYSGFDTVAARLDQIAALSGRRAIVFIQIKSFSPSSHCVPDYMLNSSTYKKVGENYYVTKNGVTTQGTYNGEYAYESNPSGPGGATGYVPNMHVAAVRDRFIALIQAFGARFDSNPNLEAVVINEAAILHPAGSVGAASETVGGVVITRPNTDGSSWNDKSTWFTNMTSGWSAAKTALSNIQCCQWINADRGDMQDANDQGFVPDITAFGVGLGMPDGAADEKPFNYNPTNAPNTGRGNIYLCQQHNGNAIIMVHASKPAMEGSVINTNQTVANAAPGQYAYPGLAWTRQQMSTWAKNTVGATHMCWGHNTGVHSVNTTYMGQNFNTVTDNHIANGSDISTVTTRPTGW